jgi:hypothetical protein
MEEQTPQPIPEESLQLGYEVRDANVKAILWFGLILAVVMVVVAVIIGLLYSFLDIRTLERAGPPPPLLEEAQGLPPQPRLQRNPALDMRQMRAENEAILNSYGWIDKQAGIVRIPIERAMELTLERGLPTRPEDSR